MKKLSGVKVWYELHERGKRTIVERFIKIMDIWRQLVERTIKMINERQYGKICWHIDNKEKFIEIKDSDEAHDWGEAHYKCWADQYKKVMQAAHYVVETSFPCVLG